MQRNEHQGTVEWHADRQGTITASNFHTVMHGTKRGWLSLIEKINQSPEDAASRFENGAPRSIRWGHDHEPEAIKLFEFMNDVSVDLVGLQRHPENSLIGASPDFLLGEDCGGEVKCPLSTDNHLAVMLSMEVPAKYFAQVQGGMWVTGRKRWWFISYDPRQRPENRLVQFVVERDQEYIERLSTRVEQFIDVWKNGAPIGKYFGGSGGEIPSLF